MAKNPTRGRRPVIWTCASVINNNLIHEEIVIPDQKPKSSTGSFPKAEAIRLFKEKYGEEPQSIKGPAIRKSLKSNNNRANRSLSNINLSPQKCRQGTYKGWKGYIFDIQDEDNGMFIFTTEIVPSGKKPPAAEKVNLSEVKFSE